MTTKLVVVGGKVCGNLVQIGSRDEVGGQGYFEGQRWKVDVEAKWKVR